MRQTTRTIIILAAVFLAAALTASAADDTPKSAVASALASRCKADLAKRLKLQVSSILLQSAQPVTWPDASLGLSEPGKMYAQMRTPGFRITLRSGNTNYLYVTGGRTIKYAGPVVLWDYSVLYTKPIKNEPNLNGDLYQCSLLGTNCAKIASGVSDFYPQARGRVLLTRRTSRSGFDLLYLDMAESVKPRNIFAAFAFGQAALNTKQDRWAAFVKPRVGAAWTVVIGPVTGEAKPLVLTLPDGLSSGEIAWSNDKLMIMVEKPNKRITNYEIDPGAVKPEWREVGTYLFPRPEYMLNKSEHLEVEETEKDGKTGVEVASVWFTGDRNVIAWLEGVKLAKHDISPGRFVNIWGTRVSKPVFYTVDIGTNEVIAGSGIGVHAKVFLYPPRTTPLARK